MVDRAGVGKNEWPTFAGHLDRHPLKREAEAACGLRARSLLGRHLLQDLLEIVLTELVTVEQDREP